MSFEPVNQSALWGGADRYAVRASVVSLVHRRIRRSPGKFQRRLRSFVVLCARRLPELRGSPFLIWATEQRFGRRV
jgi:hypothetical protein